VGCGESKFQRAPDVSENKGHIFLPLGYALGTARALGNVSFGGLAVLKISVIGDSEKRIEFALEGKLVGPWVDELGRLSDEALSQNKSLILNLEKVWFVDARGAALLRDLAGRHVSQNNCSQFVSQLVKETGE
jgi:ABC-type transporter Mla MlaB component